MTLSLRFFLGAILPFATLLNGCGPGFCLEGCSTSIPGQVGGGGGVDLRTLGISSSPDALKAKQQKTFFDADSAKHWAFYFSGSAIRYSSSSDATSWASVGELSVTPSEFGVANASVGGQGYVFLVAQVGWDVVVYRGVVATDGSAIAFDAPVTAFDGSSSSNAYVLPSITVDSSARVWVSAVRDHGTSASYRYRVLARRSTAAGNNALGAWNSVFPVSQYLTQVESASLVPKSGAEIYLLVNTATTLLAFSYDGIDWTPAHLGGGTQSTAFTAGITHDVKAMAISGSNVYVGIGTTGVPELGYGVLRWDGSVLA